MIIITILVFLVMLTVLVLIHEFGHFFTAKIFGIKVEEFGLGFPPRVLGKKKGETLYSFNALPIGGFVKLYGEDEAGSGKISSGKQVTRDLDRAFFSKPIWQRIVVVTAGVAMNLLLAIAIATYLFSTQGIPKDGKNVLVTEVEKGTPAQAAGLKTGDIIETVNSTKVTDPNALIAYTKTQLGHQMTLGVKRGNEVVTLKITPRVNAPKNEGAMGVAIAPNIYYQKYPFPQSIFYATKQALQDSVLVVKGFVDAIKTIITSFTVPAGVAGPVGMAQLTGEFVKIGPDAVLSLVYMLSLSLAVLNILPIPALDGGRLMFIIVEAITRKKVNPKYEAYAHMVGIVVLLGFLALVSMKDISRIISGQPIIPQ
jgi:regulator of sigma E protease